MQTKFWQTTSTTTNASLVMVLHLDKKSGCRDALSDEGLLAKQSEGDLVAAEACYHKYCLTVLTLNKGKTHAMSEVDITYMDCFPGKY